VDPEVSAVHGDERVAQIAQGPLAAGPELLLGDDDPHSPPLLHPVQAVNARGVVSDAPRRLLGRLDLGYQVASGRIPPRELNAGCFADQTVSSVAPHEILAPQRLAVGQPNINLGVSCIKPVTSRP
jgi:hypothetical protein